MLGRSRDAAPVPVHAAAAAAADDNPANGNGAATLAKKKNKTKAATTTATATAAIGTTAAAAAAASSAHASLKPEPINDNSNNNMDNGNAPAASASAADDPASIVPAYLRSDWDPADKHINELISALSDHGIDLPPRRERRQFYIELFRDRILPRRHKLASELEEVQRIHSPRKGGAAAPRPQQQKRRVVAEEVDSDEEEAEEEEEEEEVAIGSMVTRDSEVVLIDSSDSDVQSGSRARSLRSAEPTKSRQGGNGKAAAAIISPPRDSGASSIGARQSEAPTTPSMLFGSVGEAQADAARRLTLGTGVQQKSTPSSRRHTMGGVPSSSSSSSLSSSSVPLFDKNQDDSSKPAGGLGTASPIPGSGAQPRFIDLAGLATPIKALPDFRNVRHSPASPASFVVGSSTPASVVKRAAAAGASSAASMRTPGSAVQTRRSRKEPLPPSELMTWDSLLPSTSLKTPGAIGGSPPRKSSRVTPPKKSKSASSPGKESPGGIAGDNVSNRPKAVPRRRKRQRPPPVVVVYCAVALVLAVVAPLYYFGREKLGYRDVGTENVKWDLLPRSLDDVVSKLIPPTRTCPEGAICSGWSVVACLDSDAVLKQPTVLSWLPLRYLNTALVDFAQFATPFRLLEPTCVPDKERFRREELRQMQAEHLLARLDTVVREWMGRVECGEADKDIAALQEAEREAALSAVGKRYKGMPLSAAKRALRAGVAKKLPHDSFEDLWQMLLIRIADGPGRAAPLPPQSSPPGASPHENQASPLFYMTVFTNGHHRLLVSRSEPARSLSCSVRTRLLETAAANWHILLAIGTTIATATYLRMRSRARARDSAIAATIVEDVLEALHTEAESHAGDPIRHPVPGLSVVQVRDHFLEVASGHSGSSSADEGEAGRGSGRGAGSGNDGGGGGGGFESSQFGSEYVRTQDAQLRTRWRVPDDAARDRIWAVVAARVLRNSSVRETVMELRGEPHQVWQWIGGHALSPRKKRVAIATAAAVDGGGGGGGGGGPAMPPAPWAVPSSGASHYEQQQQRQRSPRQASAAVARTPVRASTFAAAASSADAAPSSSPSASPMQKSFWATWLMRKEGAAGSVGCGLSVPFPEAAEMAAQRAGKARVGGGGGGAPEMDVFYVPDDDEEVVVAEVGSGGAGKVSSSSSSSSSLYPTL